MNLEDPRPKRLKRAQWRPVVDDSRVASRVLVESHMSTMMFHSVEHVDGACGGEAGTSVACVMIPALWAPVVSPK